MQCNITAKIFTKWKEKIIIAMQYIGKYNCLKVDNFSKIVKSFSGKIK